MKKITIFSVFFLLVMLFAVYAATDFGCSEPECDTQFYTTHQLDFLASSFPSIISPTPAYSIKMLSEQSIYAPVSGDLNGDTLNEFVFTNSNSKISIYNYRGVVQKYLNLNTTLYGIIKTNPVLTDYNSDGIKEIIVLTNASIIQYDYNFSILNYRNITGYNNFGGTTNYLKCNNNYCGYSTYDSGKGMYIFAINNNFTLIQNLTASGVQFALKDIQSFDDGVTSGVYMLYYKDTGQTVLASALSNYNYSASSIGSSSTMPENIINMGTTNAPIYRIISYNTITLGVYDRDFNAITLNFNSSASVGVYIASNPMVGDYDLDGQIDLCAVVYHSNSATSGLYFNCWDYTGGNPKKHTLINTDMRWALSNYLDNNANNNEFSMVYFNASKDHMEIIFPSGIYDIEQDDLIFNTTYKLKSGTSKNMIAYNEKSSIYSLGNAIAVFGNTSNSFMIYPSSSVGLCGDGICQSTEDVISCYDDCAFVSNACNTDIDCEDYDATTLDACISGTCVHITGVGNGTNNTGTSNGYCGQDANCASGYTCLNGCCVVETNVSCSANTQCFPYQSAFCYTGECITSFLNPTCVNAVQQVYNNATGGSNIPSADEGSISAMFNSLLDGSAFAKLLMAAVLIIGAMIATYSSLSKNSPNVSPIIPLIVGLVMTIVCTIVGLIPVYFIIILIVGIIAIFILNNYLLKPGE
jgi:hypothetical protein